MCLRERSGDDGEKMPGTGAIVQIKDVADIKEISVEIFVRSTFDRIQRDHG